MMLLKLFTRGMNGLVIFVPVGYSNNVFECMNGHMWFLRIKAAPIASDSFCGGYDEKLACMPFPHSVLTKCNIY